MGASVSPIVFLSSPPTSSGAAAGAASTRTAAGGDDLGQELVGAHDGSRDEVREERHEQREPDRAALGGSAPADVDDVGELVNVTKLMASGRMRPSGAQVDVAPGDPGQQPGGAAEEPVEVLEEGQDAQVHDTARPMARRARRVWLPAAPGASWRRSGSTNPGTYNGFHEP